jgi:hypothetical protein
LVSVITVPSLETIDRAMFRRKWLSDLALRDCA